MPRPEGDSRRVQGKSEDGTGEGNPSKEERPVDSEAGESVREVTSSKSRTHICFRQETDPFEVFIQTFSDVKILDVKITIFASESATPQYIKHQAQDIYDRLCSIEAPALFISEEMRARLAASKDRKPDHIFLGGSNEWLSKTLESIKHAQTFPWKLFAQLYRSRYMWDTGFIYIGAVRLVVSDLEDQRVEVIGGEQW